MKYQIIVDCDGDRESFVVDAPKNTDADILAEMAADTADEAFGCTLAVAQPIKARQLLGMRYSFHSGWKEHGRWFRL